MRANLSAIKNKDIGSLKPIGISTMQARCKPYHKLSKGLKKAEMEDTTGKFLP